MASPPPPEPSASPAFLSIPLKELLAVLPEPMRAQRILSGSMDVTVSLPVAEIMPQLARGLVRVTFRLIKQGSPAGTFTASSGLDAISVTLPLSLVLGHLNPHLLSRRPDQRVVSVPPEVAPVFNVQSQPSAVMDPGISLPKAMPAPPLASPQPYSPPLPAAPPKTVEYPPQPQPKESPVPAVMPQIVISQAAKPLPVPPPASSPAPAAVVADVSPLPYAAPPPAAASPHPSGEPRPLQVPITQVMGAWPEEVRCLLKDSANGAHLEIPWAEAEMGMKQGRLTFGWARVRDWIRPALGEMGASINPQLEISLPLNQIVPLFMARAAKTRPQKRMTVADNIPDVFSGKASSSDASNSVSEAASVNAILPPEVKPAATPVPAPPPAPSLPVVESSPPANWTQSPPPPSIVPPLPAAAPAESVNTDLGQLFAMPGKTVWTPMELVQKTSRLTGVAGALIALPDGLLVTSEIPADMDGEVIAAFLPQMFGRMNHYVKELKLGELTSLRFGVGQYVVLVYRLPNLYFLALGKPGVALPEVQLAAVAAQLTRQSK